MRRGLRFYLIGSAALLALAGCGRGIVQQFAERDSWRREAEVNCLQSGAVKETGTVVRIEPIEGPGMCGADYPLKVAALGAGPTYGYSDELRPPGAIPGAASGPLPRWPIAAPRYAPPPIEQRALEAPAVAPASAPLSLSAPGVVPIADAPQSFEPAVRRPVPDYPPRAPDYAPPRAPHYAPSTAQPRADDIPDDAILPDRGRAVVSRPSYQPLYAPSTQPLPRLGPLRDPSVTGAVKTAVKPAATLACPMISALDQWITEAVQPAAIKWFRQPVVEIKQISAYACRGMVGSASAHMSEHAFGNALDIAGFVLADGHTISVKNGWDGTPEETGFLHDVQLAACERFTTVLAPGYNVYHYDHIHLDLMRRASGRSACKPYAMPGEVAAARAAQKTKYARRGDPAVTGSIGAKTAAKPHAVPGEDGEFDDDE